MHCFLSPTSFLPLAFPLKTHRCLETAAEAVLNKKRILGAQCLGFDVGMKEDVGLFRVQKKESEGQVFLFLWE